jgi:metal-dependent HD superfamily phosphatase/phosphodiesterase
MTALPNAAELHLMARAGRQPDVFADVRQRMKDAESIVAIERAMLHDLIREAHRQGVGPAVLARWSGYDPSRIYQILDT